VSSEEGIKRLSWRVEEIAEEKFGVYVCDPNSAEICLTRVLSAIGEDEVMRIMPHLEV
jgi:hypothetical protein